MNQTNNHIVNYHPKMEYRPFGKAGDKVSVITLGGMRFKHGWNAPREEMLESTLKDCERNVQWALEAGINHIESAYGYGKSELAFAQVLNERLKIPRDKYLFMNKGTAPNAKEMIQRVEGQLKSMKMEYFDYYAYHGINNLSTWQAVCAVDGALEGLESLKKRSLVKQIGFSTHGPLEAITAAIDSDRFDFVNLHYYFIFQRNQLAVKLAGEKKMGIFIISPNDKGGRLFEPSKILTETCRPLTPIQWNARFCLNHPEISTLSFGMTEKEHYEEMRGIFPFAKSDKSKDREILHTLNKKLQGDVLDDWNPYEMFPDPSGLHIPEIFRMRRLYRQLGMDNYIYYRYNMFEGDGTWVPGHFPSEDRLKKIDMSKFTGSFDLISEIRNFHKIAYRRKE